jgi:hypothetical protein
MSSPKAERVTTNPLSPSYQHSNDGMIKTSTLATVQSRSTFPIF